MAIFRGFQFPLDGGVTTWGPFQPIRVIRATRSIYQIATRDGSTVTWRGRNLGYASNGAITRGIFDSIFTQLPNGRAYYRGTGLRANARRVYSVINQPQPFFRYLYRGNDVDRGSASGDRMFGGIGGNDRVFGLGGDDIIVDQAGNDYLNGGTGNDTILGSTGRERIVGGPGDDLISGGVGADVLSGQGGRDRFLFDIGRPFRRNLMGVDRIIDFRRNVDDIVIDRTTFTAFRNNQVSFASVANAVQAARSNALITYARGTLYYNENGAAPGFGSGGAFAQLQNRSPLTANDFIVQP